MPYPIPHNDATCNSFVTTVVATDKNGWRFAVPTKPFVKGQVKGDQDMKRINKAETQGGWETGTSARNQGSCRRHRWAVKSRVKHATLRWAVAEALQRLRSSCAAPVRLRLHIFEVGLPPGSTWDGDRGVVYLSAENLEARCGLHLGLWAEEVTSALGRWLDAFGGNHGPRRLE